MSIPPPPGPHQPQGPYQPPQSGLPQYPQYPQAPYGQQPPYQPWGQGYGTHPAQAPVNGLAIASLVLGLLCFLPGVGLVLGVAALVQVRRRGERGKAMAVTGSVFSGIGLGLLVLTLATGGAAEFWQGVKEGASERSSLSLATGDCFDTSNHALDDDLVGDVTHVACDGGHDGEVFATYRLGGSGYPGEDAVGESAGDRCYGLEDTYVLDVWAVPDDIAVYYFTPTEDSWADGDRDVVCVFGSATRGGRLTDSYRQGPEAYSADQLAYLKAAHVLNAALGTAPDSEYVEDDLTGNKAWAARMATALGKQTSMLRAHRWGADAEQPVAALVDDLGKARAEWAKAAQAPDVDTFFTHYDKGYKLIDPHRTVTVRDALGLTAVPPAYEDGSGGGGGGSGSGGGGSGVEV